MRPLYRQKKEKESLVFRLFLLTFILGSTLAILLSLLLSSVQAQPLEFQVVDPEALRQEMATGKMPEQVLSSDTASSSVDSGVVTTSETDKKGIDLGTSPFPKSAFRQKDQGIVQWIPQNQQFGKFEVDKSEIEAREKQREALQKPLSVMLEENEKMNALPKMPLNLKHGKAVGSSSPMTSTIWLSPMQPIDSPQSQNAHRKNLKDQSLGKTSPSLTE